MKCPSLESLSAYIEGELSAGETALIEKHLSQCEACQTEIEMFGGVDRVLKDFVQYEQLFSAQTEESCLSDDLIVALVTGTADDLQRKQAEIHLAECSFCLHEVALMQKKISLARQDQLPDVPENLKRQTLDAIMRHEWKSPSILSIVIEFIQEGLRLLSPVDDSLRFATSVVRGERDITSEASSLEMSKDFQEHGISLSMLLEKGLRSNAVKRRADRASLVLTLTKLKSIEPITNVVVSIKGERYPTQTTDANGQVRFRNLKKKTYQIELQKNGEATIASIALTLQ